MPLWEQVKSNLVEWYSVAADKTEELAKIGMRRYDRFGISRDIERQFTELGNFVFEAVNRDDHRFFDDPTFQAIVQRIRELEKELQQKEQEIADIRQSHAQRAAAKAQVVVQTDQAEGDPVGQDGPRTEFGGVSPAADAEPIADANAEATDAGGVDDRL